MERPNPALLGLMLALPLAACATQPERHSPTQTTTINEAATKPFDPLAGEYPQVFWMLNVYEVPGQVEVAADGRVATSTKGKPNLVGTAAPTDIDAVFASIEAVAGQRLVSAPALIVKLDQEGSIATDSEDKAGNALEHRAITLRASDGKSELRMMAEVTVGAGGFSVTSHIDERHVPTGGAFVMAIPGPRSTDPWTIVTARPTMLRSLKDYPFQTSTSLESPPTPD